VAQLSSVFTDGKELAGDLWQSPGT